MKVLGAFADLSGHIGQHVAVAGRRGREYSACTEVLVGTLRDVRESATGREGGRAVAVQVETAGGLEEIAVLEHVFVHTDGEASGEYELATAPDLLAAGGASVVEAGERRHMTEVVTDHYLSLSGAQVGPGM